MLKAYHYRLYPNAKQQEMLAKHFGCARFIYNWGLDTKTRAYVKTKKSLSVYALKERLPEMKAKLPWLSEVNSQSLQSSLFNLDAAFTNFFRRSREGAKQKGYPRFKEKNGRQSFQCPQSVKFDFEHNRISIPKVKEIKVVFSRKFEGKVKTVTISKTPAQHYFVSVLVETKDLVPAKPKINRETAVGIDLGLKDFAILSNGEKIANPRFNYKMQTRLRRLNRRISRQFRMNNNKHTKNRDKNCIKRARVFEKNTNQKMDFLNKLSTRLICENQTICLEDLNISGMMKNHKVAESFASVSLSKFVEMMKYKAEWYGKNLLFIGRFDPSSKISNCCGYYNKNLKLSDRSWICPDCGKILDRDVNAARNIVDFALQKQNLIEQVPLDKRELTLQEMEPLLVREKLSASPVIE